MRRVDRLLIKIQQAQTLDAMQVSVAFVEPDGGNWKAVVDLWDGVDAPKGKTERLTLTCATEEEAVAAVEEVKAVHAPTGRKIRPFEGVTIVNDLPRD